MENNTKKQPLEEIPLSELIESRKGHYLGKIGEVSSYICELQKQLETAYEAKDITQIDYLEKQVLGLEGLGNGLLEKGLSKIVDEPLGQTPEETRRGYEEPAEPNGEDTRPILTMELYIEARKEGLTNRGIQENYQITKPNQLQGYASRYAEQERLKNKRPKTLKKATYFRLRQEGKTTQEITNAYNQPITKIASFESQYKKLLSPDADSPVEPDSRELLTDEIYKRERAAGRTNRQIKIDYRLATPTQLRNCISRYNRALKKREQLQEAQESE